LRAIDDAVLPSTLGPLDITMMFGNLEELPFKGFGGLLWAYRLFDRFDEEVPGRLSSGEWNTIMNLERYNQNLLTLIDELYMPT